MQISFTTKEESKRAQEQAFLALSPAQRFISFLKLMKAVNNFHTRKREESTNFVIERKKQK